MRARRRCGRRSAWRPVARSAAVSNRRCARRRCSSSITTRFSFTTTSKTGRAAARSADAARSPRRADRDQRRRRHARARAPAAARQHGLARPRQGAAHPRDGRRAWRARRPKDRRSSSTGCAARTGISPDADYVPMVQKKTSWYTFVAPDADRRHRRRGDQRSSDRAAQASPSALGHRASRSRTTSST